MLFYTRLLHELTEFNRNPYLLSCVDSSSANTQLIVPFMAVNQSTILKFTRLAPAEIIGHESSQMAQGL